MRKLALSLSLALAIGVAIWRNVAVADSVRDVLAEYGLEGVLDDVPDALEIDLDAVTVEASLDPRNPGELMMMTQDGVLLRINTNSRKCVGYLREHTDEDPVLAVGERIEESEAVRIAVKLLADANVKYAPETLTTQPSFRGEPSPEDLAHAHYTRPRDEFQGLPPERQKKTSWSKFLKTHWEVMDTVDFTTIEVWTRSGLTTFYILVVMKLSTRRIEIAGITPNPDAAWVQQMGRNLTDCCDG